MWIFFCLQNFAVSIVNKVAGGAEVIHSIIFSLWEGINKPHQSSTKVSGSHQALLHCSVVRQKKGIFITYWRLFKAHLTLILIIRWHRYATRNVLNLQKLRDTGSLVEQNTLCCRRCLIFLVIHTHLFTYFYCLPMKINR